MAGASDGSPDHGNKGSRKLSMCWKGVNPVAGLQREFYRPKGENGSRCSGGDGSMPSGNG